MQHPEVIGPLFPQRQISPEKRLWQSVIWQALIDATSDAISVQAVRDRDRAASWISGRGRKFREVCSHADMDPDFVSAAFRAGRITRDALKNYSRHSHGPKP